MEGWCHRRNGRFAFCMSFAYGHHYRPRYSHSGYYHAPRFHHYGTPHYGYAPRHAYAPRYAPQSYHYGHRVLRRYY